MPRGDKPLKLREVDDEIDQPGVVIRLQNAEIKPKKIKPKEEEPILLVPQNLKPNDARGAGGGKRVDAELRTHQPGVEVLLDQGGSQVGISEDGWGQETGHRNPIPWGWFALVGLMLAGALIWSLSRVKTGDERADQIRIESQSTLVDEEKEEREAALFIDRMEQTIRTFFDSTTVETMARLVRQRERVLPLMRQWYADQPVFSGHLKSVKMLQPLTLENRGNFWMASASLTDGTTRSLILEIEASGEPRIDWETLVCYQPMKWDDFATRKPTSTSLDFRVYVERDHFYSHEFANSTRWVSYRLTALDSGETLFGYVAAGSAEAGKIEQILSENGIQRGTLILRLSFPENLQSRQGVVIEKILSARWIYLDPPDSGS